MRAVLLTALILAPSLGAAQEHRHTPGMTHPPSAPAGNVPALAGQDAFAAVAEVVKILEADSATDWSRVNLEALRQHLIDMNEVTLRSAVRQVPVAGGVSIEVSGSGRTQRAIGRIVTAHAPMLDRLAGYTTTTTSTPMGVRWIVRAEDPADQRMVAKIRGLGFIGLLTAGAHHGPHHLALARGDGAAHAH